MRSVVSSPNRTAPAARRLRPRDLLDVILIEGHPHLLTAPGGSLVRIDFSVEEAGPALQFLLGAAAGHIAPDNLIDQLAGLLDRSAASALLDAVCDLGLLVRADDLKPAGNLDLRTQRQLLMRRARRYADYSSAAVFTDDTKRMARFAAEENPPPLEGTAPGPKLTLPHPAATDPEGELDRLGHLMFFTFGLLRPARFLEILDVQLRAVPSFGARHPFDALITIPHGMATVAPPGRYVYLPSHHQLAYIRPTHDHGDAWQLDILAVYERVQWRYRESIAYDMVLLDLGHLTHQLRAVARMLGWHLRAAPVHRQDGQPLQEEIVATFTRGES
jgi:hypothetical protein